MWLSAMRRRERRSDWDDMLTPTTPVPPWQLIFLQPLFQPDIPELLLVNSAQFEHKNGFKTEKSPLSLNIVWIFSGFEGGLFLNELSAPPPLPWLAALLHNTRVPDTDLSVSRRSLHNFRLSYSCRIMPLMTLHNVMHIFDDATKRNQQKIISVGPTEAPGI